MAVTSAHRRRSDPTIQDVAERAGVARSTVSKHVNGGSYVSEATAARVQAAIDELGYQPYGPGRSLAKGRTGLIGVIVASLMNPFYAELVSALDNEARGHSLNLVLGATDDIPGKERRVSQVLRRSGVDGLIVASAHIADQELEELSRVTTPFVLASRHSNDVEADFVTVDGRAGGRLAVEHLIKLGHRRIAYLGGPRTVLQFQERFEGYEASLRSEGIDVRDDWVLFDLDGLGGGRSGLRRMLDLPREEWPTAVFAATDYIGLGVMAQARDAGLEIPDDLSVVGFDNISFGEVGHRPLTTVDGRIEDIGRSALRLLMNRIENGREAEPFQQEILMPYLQIRESSASPASGTVSR